MGIFRLIYWQKASIIKSAERKKQRRCAEMQVNIPEAQTELPKLIQLIETGKEEQIIFTRYGKPIVQMTVYNDAPVSKRIGIAKGRLKSPDDLDKYNDEVAGLFDGAVL